MDSTPVLYDVKVNPARHALEVQVEVDRESAGGQVHLRVPAWVPGAYSFLRFARAVGEVTAVDAESGAALPVERCGWSGWSVAPAPSRVRVRYVVQASGREWSELVGVVDHDQALVTGTLLVEAVGHAGPCHVRYQFPEGWPVHFTSGAEVLADGTRVYPDYAALADALVVAGAFEHVERTSRGTTVHHVFLDRGVGFTRALPAFLQDSLRAVDECWRIFGTFPFPDYTFITSFSPLYPWGMEHRTCCTVGLETDVFMDAGERARALRLLVHEVLHAWNGCALRPRDQMDADRVRGTNPELLWVVEGWTRYYEFLLSVRAGLMPAESLISNVVNYYRELHAAPAYSRVSARDSCRSAFLTHHRFAGAINTSLDYYDVGMLIAFELDAGLRMAGNAEGLDGVLRELFTRHAGKGYTREDVRALVAARSPELALRLDAWVDGVAALTVPRTLEELGFHVAQERVPRVGLLVRAAHPDRVADVWDDGPAARAGVMPGDELVRVDNQPYSLPVLRWSVLHEEQTSLEVRRGHRTLRFEVRPEPRERLARVTWAGTTEDAERLRAWWRTPALRPAAGAPWPLDSHENFHGIPVTC